MRLLPLALLLVTACAFDPTGPGGEVIDDRDDAGVDDVPDAGEPDASAPAPDAGFDDAGPVDAGESDAGGLDAGESDAGAGDAGGPDAGEPQVDAGASDAGPLDAGEGQWTAAVDTQGTNVTGLRRGLVLDAEGAHTAYLQGDTVYSATCTTTACSRRAVTILLPLGAVLRQPFAAADSNGRLRLAGVVTSSGVYDGTLLLGDVAPTMSLGEVEHMGRVYDDVRLAVNPVNGRRHVLYRSKTVDGYDPRLRLASASATASTFSTLDRIQTATDLALVLDPAGNPIVGVLDGTRLLVTQGDDALELEQVSAAASSISIAASSSQLVAAFVEPNSGGLLHVLQRDRPSGTWVDTPLEDADANEAGTAVAIDPDGTITVAWVQRTGFLPTFVRGVPGAWTRHTLPSALAKGSWGYPALKVVDGSVHLLGTVVRSPLQGTIGYARWVP